MQDLDFNVKSVKTQEWSIKILLEHIVANVSQVSKDMEEYASQDMNLILLTNNFQMVGSNRPKGFHLIIFFSQMVLLLRVAENSHQMYLVNSLLMEQLDVLYIITLPNAKFSQTFVSYKCMTQAVQHV